MPRQKVRNEELWANRQAVMCHADVLRFALDRIDFTSFFSRTNKILRSLTTISEASFSDVLCIRSETSPLERLEKSTG